MSSEQLPPKTRSAPRENGRAPLGGVSSGHYFRTLLGLPSTADGTIAARALTAPSGGGFYSESLLSSFEERHHSSGEPLERDVVVEEVRETSKHNRQDGDDRWNTHDGERHRDAPPSLTAGNGAGHRALSADDIADRNTPAGSVFARASVQSSELRPSVARAVDVTDVSHDALRPQSTVLPTRRSAAGELADVRDTASLVRSQPSGHKTLQHDAGPATVAWSAPVSTRAHETTMRETRQAESSLVDQLDQLRRTVRDLEARVASQAARHHEEIQAERRGRTSPPPRVVVVTRSEASSMTPRAFWERRRMARLSLRTGR